MPSERAQTPPHISINGDDVEGHDTPKSARSSSGWDGKLRLEKKLELVNPEALSDPEYSDEESLTPMKVYIPTSKHHPTNIRLTIHPQIS
jgi:protein phosphatase 1 regulatory subunit 7